MNNITLDFCKIGRQIDDIRTGRYGEIEKLMYVDPSMDCPNDAPWHGKPWKVWAGSSYVPDDSVTITCTGTSMKIEL